MSAERGVIQNRGRANQVNSFKNLIRMRNITPTDIDGFIDYAGTAFVYLEGKFQNGEFKKGQRIALENAVLSHSKAGHPSIAILYEHNEPAHIDVEVAYQFVKAIYSIKPITGLTNQRGMSNGKATNWFFPYSKAIQIKDALSLFEKFFNIT